MGFLFGESKWEERGETCPLGTGAAKGKTEEQIDRQTEAERKETCREAETEERGGSWAAGPL